MLDVAVVEYPMLTTQHHTQAVVPGQALETKDGAVRCQARNRDWMLFPADRQVVEPEVRDVAADANQLGAKTLRLQAEGDALREAAIENNSGVEDTA